MKLNYLDWGFIISYMIFSLFIGIYYTKKASKNIKEFFISGRNLPWWIIGTSMVATTFAADTPLVVTGLTIKNGISGNWLWWNFVFSGTLTVFFFAKYWWRAKILTDVEFTELRYSGKAAAALRGFKAIYLGIIINTIIIGWVTLAMTKIISVVLGWNKWITVIILMSIALVYSVLSGFWGVVITDFVQFIIAIGGSITLAILAVKSCGGLSSLKTQIITQYGADKLSFIPNFKNPGNITLTLFIVYIGIQWWASWYPGAEPGGGGYIAQRMFAAKNEKHSLLATLWFNIAHYALRPWPWILIALCAMLLFPNLKDPEMGYPMVMMKVLPSGLKGLIIVSFFAAFMSTIDTQLNWGASYLVNDFYKRFIAPNKNETHYVTISRLSIIFLIIISGIVTYYMNSIKGAWQFLLSIGAGTGLVYILRWYWWRINAFSEIFAMISAIIVSSSLKFLGITNYATSIIITLSITTIVWLLATILTRPTDTNTLINFYKKVKPGGVWNKIASFANISVKWNFLFIFIQWILSILFIYFILFGFGNILLGNFWAGIIMTLISFLILIFLLKSIKGENYETTN